MKEENVILWLEEDPLEFIEKALKKEFILKRAIKISDAIRILGEDMNINVLLLDIMIPIFKEDEEYDFNPETTNRGMKSGFEFYRRFKNILEQRNIKVIVYSILGDDNEMRDAFVKLGLDQNSYLDKITNSRIDLLTKNIYRIINE